MVPMVPSDAEHASTEASTGTVLPPSQRRPSYFKQRELGSSCSVVDAVSNALVPNALARREVCKRPAQKLAHVKPKKRATSTVNGNARAGAATSEHKVASSSKIQKDVRRRGAVTKSK